MKNRRVVLASHVTGCRSGERSYADPFAIGEVIGGATVGRVDRSRHPEYAEGDWVAGAFGWQEFGVANMMTVCDRSAAAITASPGEVMRLSSD